MVSVVRPNPNATKGGWTTLRNRTGANERWCIALLFITYLAGTFSLERFQSDLAFLGQAGYARTWLILLLIGFVALLRAAKGGASIPGRMKMWVGAVQALPLYLILTVAWAPSTDGTSARIADLLVMTMLFGFAIPVCARRPEWATELIFRFTFWTSVVYAAAGLSGTNEYGRMAMAYGGPNVFVRVMAAGILAAMYLFQKTSRWRWLAPIPILFACAILSGSRGGMLSLIIVVTMILLVSVKSTKRLRLLIGVGVVFGVVVVAGGSFSLMQRVDDYVQARYVVYIPGRNTPSTLDYGERDRMFVAAYETFRQHPIFGSGIVAIDSPAIDAMPHNLVLAVARDGGSIGLMLLALTLCPLLGRFFRPKNLEHRMACGAACFFFLASLFSGSYYDTRYVWLLSLLYMTPDSGSRLEGRYVPSLAGTPELRRGFAA
jgi:O-antigen ligase